MEAILKNQLRHVSLAVSFTSSTVNVSEEDKSHVQVSLQMLENKTKFYNLKCINRFK